MFRVSTAFCIEGRSDAKRASSHARERIVAYSSEGGSGVNGESTRSPFIPPDGNRPGGRIIDRANEDPARRLAIKGNCSDFGGGLAQTWTREG